jgi:hypothetical protein
VSLSKDEGVEGDHVQVSYFMIFKLCRP